MNMARVLQRTLALVLLGCCLENVNSQKGKTSVKGGKRGPSAYPPLPKAQVYTTPAPSVWNADPPINIMDKMVEDPESFSQKQEDFSEKQNENAPDWELHQSEPTVQQSEPTVQQVEAGQLDRIRQPNEFDYIKHDEQKVEAVQTREELPERYREDEISQLNIQDTPPNEIARAYVSSGQFCSTWGPHQYRTFDGRLFRYEGQCRHILFKDCLHEEVFNVILDFSHCTTSAYSYAYSNFRRFDSRSWTTKECQPAAIVGSGDESLSIKTNPDGSWLVQRRGLPVAVPLVLDTLTVQPAGRHLQVKASCGAQLWMSPEGSMTVELPSGWRWRTCGLCGHKDGDARNDFQSPTEQLMTDSWSFGHSWMMRIPTERFPEGCPDPERPTGTPCGGQEQLSERASEICLPILSPKFAGCHHVVDPQPYLESCQTTCCDKDGVSGCECASLAEYFRECNRAGARLPSEGWRTHDLCPMHCTNGTEYGECAPTCAPTCSDPDPVCDVNRCLDGCQCPLDHVMHEGQCLSKNLCPCTLLGKDYPGGHKLKQDCNTCECKAGKWRCTEDVCAAACRLVGNRHIVTFDGFWYELPRSCSHHLLYTDGSSIQLEHVTCRGSSVKGKEATDCGRNVVIKTGDGNPVIKLKRWLEVTADGEEVMNLPTTIADVHVRIISSLYVQALLPTGVSVTWSSDGASGWVSVPASFFGRTQGLCGTYTRNQADDLLTPEGDTELGPVAFARKWKTDSSCSAAIVEDNLEHPCDRKPDLRPRAEEACILFVNRDTLGECLDLVDIAPYYGACLREVCACSEENVELCLCPLMEHLAAECSKKLDAPFHWRTAVPQCGVHCSGGQEYRPCADACQYSCAQLTNPYALNFQGSEGTCGSAVAGQVCLDGCTCPPGQALTTLRDGIQTCAPLDQCPCVYEGREYVPGFVQERNGKICECESGTWQCKFDPRSNTTDLNYRGYIPGPCPVGSNTESSGCLSDCPVTCLNMNDPPKCDTRICKGGCRCKSGFVLEPTSGQCVRPAQCPCHHGGKSYHDGQALRMDCNNCLCKGGQWVCETGQCLGKCSLHAAGHYRTFDGKVFDMDSAHCAYVLVKGHTAEGETFAITAQNVPCAAASFKAAGPICKKEIVFTIGGESVTMSREFPVQASSQWTLEEIGMFQHLVSHNLDIEILWDGKTRVYLHANPKWRGQLRGLCGDFNGDPTNDFVGPSDGPPHPAAHYFVDSWRLHDYCPRANEVQGRESREWEMTCSEERQRWARHRCQILKEDLFVSCHGEVDYQQYFERCVEDACGCEEVGGTCDCLCTAIAAYSDACAAKGVVIAWRSQELCPIMCEECDHYNPCIPVCPLDTCLYRLNEGHPDCSGRPCVEGCQLKPCQEGFVRNGTTRDAQCVPEGLCEPKWDCLVNGKVFKHGQWVSDATVADACRTCYCRRGELDCKGQRCPPPLPRVIETTPPPPPPTTIATTETPIPPTLPPTIWMPKEKPFCQQHGWSHWLNAFTPTAESGGDFEILDDPRSRLRTHMRLPCSVSMMTSIQCRPVGPSPKGNPQDDYECSLPAGLVCKNQKGLKGSEKLCRDYEIRVYCTCEEARGKIETVIIHPTTTTTTPAPPVAFLVCLPENHGWTPWINTQDSRSHPDGDFETVESALAYMASSGGAGCPLDHVTDIQCRVASDGRSWKEAQQGDVVCDVTHGLNCLHGRQPKGRKCLDYEIRVFCQCYTTVSYPPTTYPPVTEVETEALCPPGIPWSDCPYQCDQTCMAYQHKLVIEGKCELSDSHQCIPGCQYTNCQPPFVQLDEYTCVLAADCDCVLDDGTLLTAGGIIQKDCVRCQCQNNSVFCADVPYCGMPSTALPHVMMPTTCPPLAIPLCVEGFTVIHDESGPCPEYRCVPECPPGLKWYECHASCERTCLSLQERPCDRDGCVAGCFCPEGQIRDGEYCREPEECPDRVCQGFGDPQLVTFDGSTFPVQGKGSFTLANHEENSFSVSGRTDLCDLNMTCLVGLTVTYKGHKVSVRRGDNYVSVDDRSVGLEQMPVEVGGGSIVVLAQPGLNALIHVPELQAEVFYFGTQAAFAIRVPVSLFYNKTKGLCGNCNNQLKDDIPDMDNNGILSPQDICEYMTKGSYGECMTDTQNVIEVPYEDNKALCPEFEDHVFRECARLIEPQPYRAGCVRDIIQGSNSHQATCKALLEFTRQCCLATGAPLREWMRIFGCEVPCPGGATFIQCHDACPQTCTNVSAALQSSCSIMKTDACFCPDGMVLHNARCMSKSVCEVCDADGHRPGDIWKSGPCTDCHCEEDLKVVCTTPSCPSAPNCRHDENLVLDADSDKCCLRYKCELKPVPACPSPEMPNCAPGEISKIKAIAGECPEYKCECDPVMCPPIRWPSDLELGQRVEVIKAGGCCGQAEIICDEALCPAMPDCPPGTVIKKLPGPCCYNYKCKPPTDMCVYTPQMTVEEGVEVPVPPEEQIPKLYQPNDKWTDGLCRNCTCVESTHGDAYSASCMLEQCPSIKDFPDKNEYVLEYLPIPGNCCPHVVRLLCKDDEGNVHEPGMEWKSSKDNCLSYRCELSPLGDVQKVERAIVCATCPDGNEYVSPSSRLGICCGWCRPVSCEEAGRAYPLGATWNSTRRRCHTAECVASDTGVRAVYNGPNCPIVPKECPKERITWDASGCCRVCNVTLMPVSECEPTVVPLDETVGLLVVHDQQKGTCANDRPIPNLKQCAGHCESHSLYSLDDGYFQSNCECCVAETYESFDVILKCANRWSSTIRKTFKQPTSCRCSTCSSSVSAEKQRERNLETERIKQTKTSKANDWSFPDEVQQRPDRYSQLRDEGVLENPISPHKVDDTYQQRPTGHLDDTFEQRPNGHLTDNSHFVQQPTGHLTDNSHFEQQPTGHLTDSSHFVQQPTGHLTDSSHQPTGHITQDVYTNNYEQQPNGHLTDQQPAGHSNIFEQQPTDHQNAQSRQWEDQIDPRAQTATDDQEQPSQTGYGQSPFAFDEQNNRMASTGTSGQQSQFGQSPFVDGSSHSSQQQSHRQTSSSQFGQSPFVDGSSQSSHHQTSSSSSSQFGPSPFEQNRPASTGQQPQSQFGQSPFDEDSSGSSYQQSHRQSSSSQFGPSPFDQTSGHADTSRSSGYQSSSSYSRGTHQGSNSSSSSSSGSHGGADAGGDMDEWRRQMDEHQRQVQELQNLQNTYSELAQEQHQRQLDDMAALNEQQRLREQQQQEPTYG